MELAQPWLLVLAPLPLVAWYLLPVAKDRGALAAPDSIRIFLQRFESPQLSAGRGTLRGLLPKIIGWLALVIALAGPFTSKPAVLSPTGRDIVIAFDLSASMAEEDMQIAGRQMARIDVVREKLGTFVQGRRGDRFALIGFATEAFLIAPLTFDTTAIAEMLDEVSIGLPGRKTDLGRAIGLTVKLLRQEPEGERLLILISDGEVNTGELAGTDAAALARELGIRIFSIGFADNVSAGNAAHMAELAEMTGGEFHKATEPALMQDALARLNLIAPVAEEQTLEERRQDWRWPFLIVALACLLMIGWREHSDP